MGQDKTMQGGVKMLSSVLALPIAIPNATKPQDTWYLKNIYYTILASVLTFKLLMM